MKICVINSLYKPYNRGGAEVVSSNIVKKLIELGYDVFVISTGYEDLLEKIDDVKVYRVSSGNIFNYIDINKKPFWLRAIWHIIDQNNFKNAKKIKQIVNDEHPDLILTHSIKGLGYQAIKSLSKLNIKLIHTLHDVQLAVPSGLIIKRHEDDFIIKNIYNWLYTQRNKYLFSKLKNIISPSQWLADYYKQKGFFKRSKVNIVRNPIEISLPYYEKDFNNTYLYVGQIEEHKGIKLLLESFEIFKDKNPKAKLLIVGKGSLLKDMQKIYTQDWVKFLGYVKYEELGEKVFPFISYSVLPSLCYENSPGTPYDAFSNSSLVIVPRIGGSAELVTEGETGYTFEAGSHKSLIEALEKTIDSKERYKWMAMRARGEVEKYSMDEYLKKIFSI